MGQAFPKKPALPPNAVVVEHVAHNVTMQSYVPAIVGGLAVSIRHFFKNTKEAIRGELPDPMLERLEDGITLVSYPEQKRPYPERFRGVHRLTQREDGSPRCVACLCCSTACPAQCIFIDAGEYDEGDPRRGYERFPVRFVIDELRCIFCGYCVEACPCDAIRMDTGVHAAPYDSREQFIYDKDLLVSLPGRDGSHKTANPRHEPGDPTHPGLTREHQAH
ncbi:MAG TPA: NADH-quinone oxidoreductase subunit I [Polyangiaceae bacterium]|nr:NADH-quinone oxidoreductase subunit I [Polyangiaceae bacterium]